MNDREWVRYLFPNIDPAFVITSPRDPYYNCIAWAAEDSKRRWWPAPGDTFWPVDGVTEPTVAAFIEAFQTFGYAPSNSPLLEPDVVKVAIYVGDDGLVTHMARQLPSGQWTSKLGPQWDIQHETPECLNGVNYGTFARVIAKRAV